MKRTRRLALALVILAVTPALLLSPAAPASPASEAPTAAPIALASHVVWGTDGPDVLVGNKNPQTFYALAGDDYVDGAGGRDRINGGAGNDRLIGGKGKDRVNGGAGNDLIEVADGQVDQVSCGNGVFDQAVVDMKLDVVAADCERVVSESKGPATIVQLGDSVASGEGTLYGFTWDPVNMNWNQPTVTSPPGTWDGTYQGCHQSPYASGNLVSAELQADFTNFACTGATYEQGIAGPMDTVTPVETVPAQFQQLVDSGIEPDVVLISIGANDVQFSEIVRSCLASAASPPPGTMPCTAANPGPDIDSDFWAPVNDGTLVEHWIDLVVMLRNQFGGPRKLQIIFTSYYSPLERGPLNPTCALSIVHAGDSLLTEAQNTYMKTLMTELKSQLVDAVGYTPGVSIVDIASFTTGHTWCTQDPWAYGPGTEVAAVQAGWPLPPPFGSGPVNPSAFHPTPEGQAAIADLVKEEVAQVLTNR